MFDIEKIQFESSSMPRNIDSIKSFIRGMYPQQSVSMKLSQKIKVNTLSSRDYQLLNNELQTN